MPFKDILVYLDNGRGWETRLRLAGELARRQGAHLTGLYGIEPLPLGAANATRNTYVEVETVRLLQQRYRDAALEAAAAAEQAFRETARAAAVGEEWRLLEGDVAQLATLHARYADLMVLGQVDPDNPGHGSAQRLPESVLVGSGRPALLVPYVGRFETVGDTVLVAWNATREAARAVNDAIPILQGAQQVTVLSVNPARGIAGDGDLPAADIAHHLARHGIKAEASYTVAEDVEVGDLILSRAADLGADLIVMGGYGHSRTRELILGGATRSLLEHMTVPVLLSH
jgi:nucleotide-binding universal stress UspA family protein